MKKFICLALAIILCFGMCACTYNTTNENEEKVKGLGNYVVIEESNDGLTWLVYDKTNMLCYDICAPRSNSRIITPYMTVQDGMVYYTLYNDGELVPAPAAIFTDSMFQMIKGWLK